jgi:hypothetical protein
MAKSPSHRPGDNEKKIADADWLLSDTPKAKADPKAKARSSPSPQTPPSRSSSESDHGYGLAEGHEVTGDSAELPVPPVAAPAATPRRPKPKIDSEGMEEGMGRPAEPSPTASQYDDSTPDVDQVWTRGAEWGGHLFLMAMAGGLIGFLIYLSFSLGMWFLAFLLMMAGGVVMMALCYPLFITLERPVRITPEQAAKDYYGMLSHMLPHYPRMWLLLSSAGRRSGEFHSFGQFQGYWRRTLAKLQGGLKATSLNPLRFKVEDFRSEKSAGATVVNARFTLRVYRGDPGTGTEVASYSMSTGMVKGPDRMWYLNSGTLPNERR